MKCVDFFFIFVKTKIDFTFWAHNISSAFTGFPPTKPLRFHALVAHQPVDFPVKPFLNARQRWRPVASGAISVISTSLCVSHDFLLHRFASSQHSRYELMNRYRITLTGHFDFLNDVEYNSLIWFVRSTPKMLRL